MEKIDKDPKELPERSVLPKKQKENTRLSTHKVEKQPNEEVTKQPKREEEQERTKRIINLQRELTTSVTNIQTAGDAKWLERRAELEEANRIREQQENEAKAIQQSYDEKKKHNNDLQQELKKRDHEYVKTLRNNEEEIDLLTERMKEHMRVQTKAYREQYEQTVTVYQQENEASLAEFMTEYEQEMKELYNKERAQFMERRDAAERYAEELHDQLLKDTHLHYQKLGEDLAAKFKMVREEERKKNAALMKKLKAKANRIPPSDKKGAAGITMSKQPAKTLSAKNKMSALQKDKQTLRNEQTNQQKELTQKRHKLSERSGPIQPQALSSRSRS